MGALRLVAVGDGGQAPNYRHLEGVQSIMGDVPAMFVRSARVGWQSLSEGNGNDREKDMGQLKGQTQCFHPGI